MRSFLGLQQRHFIGFANSMQTVWMMGFASTRPDSVREKCGCGKYRAAGLIAHKRLVEQATVLLLPADLVTQLAQQRAVQCIKGYAVVHMPIVEATPDNGPFQ